MALPAEPRQKMINLMYLVLTALLALNVSSEILNAFKVVDKSLTTSNSNLTSANNTLYASLEAKLKDPVTSEKAKPWNDKALIAKQLSTDLSNYIDQLKVELKKEAGEHEVEKDGQKVMEFKEDDLEAATRLFGNEKGGKNKGPELQKKLNDFRESMLNIDSSIRKEFEKTFPVDVQDKVIGQDGKPKEFTFAYFHMTPTVAALTLLSKFQNNVKNAENQVVTYCHNQVGAVKVVYDQFSALVGQSSNYIMPGEEMEITAGVGAYSKAAQPVISINGSNVALGEDGKASSKFKVSGSGSRTVPVVVRYTTPKGDVETKTFDVKYTVGTPGGAAVMPDKMNVFYIGVDNPVTIGSPTGWDKTTVNVANGTITGQGSNRIVRPAATPGQKTTITVVADKKPTTFEFRIKRIPDPIFKIGSGKTRLPAVEFKSQSFCRAELENFDFDLRFNVVSATVYFSGANFPNIIPATLTGNNLSALGNNMAKCGPGSTITFDNIKVQGPDGVRTIEGRAITLY
jgi:gliding motility-associated protein GldM